MTIEIPEGIGKLVDARGSVSESISHAGRCILPGIGMPARITVKQSGDGSGVIIVKGTSRQLKFVHCAIAAALESDSEDSEDESIEDKEGNEPPRPMDEIGGDSDGSCSICEDGPDKEGMCRGCGGLPGGRGCSWCYEE
jgi:hypothetical protein